MNKAQLVEAVAEQLGGRKAAAEAVDAVLDTMVRAVVAGDRVSVTGFGTFEKVDRSARFARNPQTGERVKVKKTAVPRFRPGQGFKDLVAGSKKLPKDGPSVKKAPKGSLTPGKTGTTAAVKRAATKRATTAAAAAPAKRTAAKKTTAAAAAPAKKTVAKKTTATATKKATAVKKATATKAAATKATATKTAAAKKAAPVKKTTTAKATPAKKTTAAAKKTTATAKKTAPAKKTAARKTTSRRSTAK
ncbi:HU family DNA-binding protein [Kitasatospora sp. NPDC096147]|uniref:HU family DNA-binding protein n=1 Tax=Kitasatospora sp. NPDC096147 TaxID=3364093 RepID=UPI00382DEED7